MFVIRCPHCCEAREEEEFSYAGEAFIARPAAPEELDDEAWGDYVFMKKNPKGWHWEMWTHSTGCRKFFVIRRHTANHAIGDIWTLAEARAAYEVKEAATA
jgi:sarcosine oxidase subunit delta